MTPYQIPDRFDRLTPILEDATDEGRGPSADSDGHSSRGWRGLLAWSPTSAPVALLLLAGIAFGPRGINLLSLATLSLLDPVVPVALAALGVLVGLGVGDRRTDHRRLLGAACVVAVVTMLVVSVGFAMAAPAASSMARPFWILILTSGICAATSLTLPSGNALERPTTAVSRVIELSVLLPIVAGGLVLAWLRQGVSSASALLVAQAIGVTIALAAAAWLLLARAASETEERVFAVSALLLVGGVADALSLSALFGGLAAGVFWRYAGRHPRDTIGRDVLFVQHPLLLLVLLVAGARADLTPLSLGCGGGYVVLRLVGQLSGGAFAGRVAGVNTPGRLGFHLLAPGVFGVAFALNALSVLGPDASMLLATVVVGTIGSEVVAIFLPPRTEGA